MNAEQAATLRRAGVSAEKVVVARTGAGGVADPHGGDLGAYRACAAVLEDVAEEIVARLTAIAG